MTSCPQLNVCGYSKNNADCVYISSQYNVMCSLLLCCIMNLETPVPAPVENLNIQIVVPPADPTTTIKKNNRKKHNDREHRTRNSKSVEPQDQKYDDICRQLAALQKQLNALKQLVSASRVAEISSVTAVQPKAHAAST